MQICCQKKNGDQFLDAELEFFLDDYSDNSDSE